MNRDYTSALIELGYADGRREWPRIKRFLAAWLDTPPGDGLLP